MTMDGVVINCVDTTIQQIQDCVKKRGVDRPDTGPYFPLLNDCKDWSCHLLHSCCLSRLPYEVPCRWDRDWR